jgi:hypothetical protein
MADRPTLASAAKLYEKIGYTPTGGEVTRAADCLVEASELIRDEAEKTWLNDAESAVVDVPPVVERVCLAAAYRGFDNARALTQRSIGDDSKSWDRAGVEGGAQVYLTATEKRRVRKAAGGSTFQAVTMVSPYSGDYPTLTDTVLGS